MSVSRSPNSTILSNSTGRISLSLTLKEVFERLKLPTQAVAQAHKIWPRILAGEDSVALAQEVAAFYERCDRESQFELLWLVCEDLGEARPFIAGTLLRRAWSRGVEGSLLSGSWVPTGQMLDWFEHTSPQTLMTEQERTSLAGLPDPVVAYRSGPGPLLRNAAAGVSWTLDANQTGAFVCDWNKFSRGEAMNVSAEIPRDAVVAFFNEAGEQELVVKHHQARFLEHF